MKSDYNDVGTTNQTSKSSVRTNDDDSKNVSVAQNVTRDGSKNIKSDESEPVEKEFADENMVSNEDEGKTDIENINGGSEINESKHQSTGISNKNETSNNDGLYDKTVVLNNDSNGDDTYYKVHTVKLMLYIIAPVSALVVMYFIMKAVKGKSRHFFKYQIVGARADNIELRPLGYESDEEDIVFDASSRK